MRFGNCRFILAILVIAAVAGCARTVVLENIDDQSVIIPDGTNAAAAIKTAILEGGIQKGWRMVEVEPGHIVGTIQVRTHSASVDIFYDKDSYSIEYKDSKDLMYDGEKIHRNYNKWIILLNQQIALNLPSG